MKKSFSESGRIEQLQAWYATPYGAALHAHIWQVLKIYLKRIPVQSFVPVGLPFASDKPMHASMGEQISLVMEHDTVDLDDLTLFDSLPLEADSQSCLVYHHLLDVLDDPYQLLREANRVLDDAGYLIVINFNPWSLYGLARILRTPLSYFSRSAPWALKAYSQSRLLNWLRVLEFVPCSSESCGFVPPVVGGYSTIALEKTEPAISNWFSRGGMVNVVLYRKNLAPVTPIRTRWKVTSAKIPRGRLQPNAQTSAQNQAGQK